LLEVKVAKVGPKREKRKKNSKIGKSQEYEGDPKMRKIPKIEKK
jgi:hypothetical protein